MRGPLAADTTLTSLLGISSPFMVDVAAQWRPRPPRARLRVPIGSDADGQPVELDIKESAQGGMGPHGLVVGATGSGKSTTLAALAQEALRRRSIVLTTLEDPIEFALAPPESSLVRRRQVGRDVRDFVTGLRDALRQDPDVLLVGEMRDRETIGLALTAAETGHLVLSSLHSRSAASADWRGLATPAS